jgi:glutamate synthase domain-containing protein 3
MTGGRVIVLGKTGRNFAAGMSGGIAYVYDEDGQFARRCNTAMVSLGKVLPADEQEQLLDRAVWHLGQADETLLKRLIADHHQWTGSLRARHILDHWAESRAKFVKVFPNDYRRALAELGAQALGGESEAAAKATIAKARSKPAKAVAAK